jgi:protein RecA
VSIKDILNKTVQDLGKKKAFQFGAGKPHTAENYGVGDVPMWIPFGITQIDRALGGGLPLGRISELFSDNESEGKSTLILHALANVQKMGGVAVLLDSEASLDRPRASRMGIDLEQLVIFGPPTVEDGFEFIDALLRNVEEDKGLQESPILIVWDTIAAAPTRTEKAAAKKEGDAFAGGMVEKPRIIARAMRNYVQEFFKWKLHLCLVNQSITNVGGGLYGPKYMTPGGKSIKFYATLRIKCKKSGWVGEARNLDSADQKTGIKCTVQAVKNKLSLPFQPQQCVLYGERGFSEIMSLAEFLLAQKEDKCIAQKGSWIYLPGGKKCYWKKLEETVEANPKILEKWQATARKLIPIPPNRELDTKTGWYVRKEGTALEEAPETEEAPEV